MTWILAIDPGRVTGFAMLSGENDNLFDVWQIDSRGYTREAVTQAVTEDVAWYIEKYDQWGRELHVVVEDFTLRLGQAVDTAPLHTIGGIDVVTEFENFKYSPGAHKNGNKAYDISKMIKDSGAQLEGDHKADALSLAFHHWKIVDTKNALKVLEGYKK